MARINGSVSQRQDAYEFYIIWEESDVNIADNTRKITATSYIYCKKHSAYNYDDYDHYITIDGQEFKTTVSEVVLSAGKTVKLATGSKVIRHNDDGSKSITISASSPKLPAGNGYGPASGSASGTATLTTIPRTSGVTCADGNIGSSTVININRASNSFTHTLKYVFGSLSGTIVEKHPDSTYGWNIPTDFFGQIPNNMSGYGTVISETYSGDTLVGTSSCGFNAFVVNSNPIINGNAIDVNDRTVALTGDNNKIVKYCSNAKVDIVATAQNSASITYVGVTAGNQSRDGSSVILEAVETNVFNINCRDSRGLLGNNTIVKTLVDYIRLAFTSIDVQRTTTTSNTVNVSLRGNYFNNSFGIVNNSLILKFRSRLANGNWGDYIHLNANIDGNTFNYSGELGNNFDYQEGYEFEFYVEDRLMTDIKYRTLTAGQPIIDIGKNDVRVNGNLAIYNKTINDMLKKVGGVNYLRNSSNMVTMVKPDNNYNQYWYENTHPLALKKVEEDKAYTLSFKFIPEQEGYFPASSIVVGGVSTADAWDVRLPFSSDWEIENCGDYYVYTASFIIMSGWNQYLQNRIGFILESGDANIGGIINDIKLEEGYIRTDCMPMTIKKLWENLTPNEAFAGTQIINLSSDDYDLLIWFYKRDKDIDYVDSTIIPKGFGGGLGYVNTYGAQNNAFREVTRHSDIAFEISFAFKGGYDAAEDNIIPIQVLGIKF